MHCCFLPEPGSSLHLGTFPRCGPSVKDSAGQTDAWFRETHRCTVGGQVRSLGLTHSLRIEYVHSPALLAFKLVHWAQDVTESAPCLEIQETFGLKAAEEKIVLMLHDYSHILSCVCQCVPYRKLGKRRVVDPPSKGIFLKLQQLDHQARQGLTGWRVILDVLQRQHHTLKKHWHLHQNICTIYTSYMDFILFPFFGV